MCQGYLYRANTPGPTELKEDRKHVYLANSERFYRFSQASKWDLHLTPCMDSHLLQDTFYMTPP